MANASVEKLWQQAVKSAGAAFAEVAPPELPSLSMREVGSALLSFLELLWLAAARSRLGDAAARIAQGWWAAPGLALFSTTDGPWWLVTLAPRKAPRVEAGARDDLLAMIPDAHFAQCVTTVMRELER